MVTGQHGNPVSHQWYLSSEVHNESLNVFIYANGKDENFKKNTVEF